MLGIYLNDHLAGATTGRELARRAARSNQGSDYGRFLAGLADEIDEDRESLLQIMGAVGVRTNRLKLIGGWGAEKLGRFKLNGRLVGYSPLSRVVELEALTLGVHGKLALWQSLLRLDLPGLESAMLEDLEARATRQLRALEQTRLQAVTEALG